jgi:hypothetical protein
LHLAAKIEYIAYIRVAQMAGVESKECLAKAIVPDYQKIEKLLEKNNRITLPAPAEHMYLHYEHYMQSFFAIYWKDDTGLKSVWVFFAQYNTSADRLESMLGSNYPVFKTAMAKLLASV